ncbi:hypothetical protein B5J95_21135, partial [Ralstonia solanacearum]
DFIDQRFPRTSLISLPCVKMGVFQIHSFLSRYSRQSIYVIFENRIPRTALKSPHPHFMALTINVMSFFFFQLALGKLTSKNDTFSGWLHYLRIQ